MRHHRSLALLGLSLLAPGAPRDVIAGDRDVGPAAPVTLQVAAGERKVALVIGNGKYRHTSSLAQAPKDADTIEAALRAQGFEVIAVDDADKAKLEKAIIDAEAKMKGAAVALFYYAGHGVQVEGENYLIPVDATLAKKEYVRVEAVPVDRVLQAMERAGSRLNVVVLDACRNNPWAKSWFTDQRSIEASRGLTGISQPGFLLAYSTLKGRAAPDDGVYAATLARYLGEPCMSVDEVFQSVFRDVNARNPEQVPWTEGARQPSSLYLSRCDAPRRGSEVGETLTVNVKLASYELRRIRGGPGVMGSAATDPDHQKDEQLHDIYLDYDFWMGATEVTQGMYQAVTGANPSSFVACGLSCPVEQVSWLDAATFANGLSRSQRLEECYVISGTTVTMPKGLSCVGYRLPTEAEWEYAARAGEDKKYAGSNEVGAVAWYSANSGETTHPVGKKAPNKWGLYDMSGNVWEWAWDWYGETYTMDPLGPTTGSRRVYRGGSWSNDPQYARVAYRGRDDPSARNSNLGFRLARSIP